MLYSIVCQQPYAYHYAAAPLAAAAPAASTNSTHYRHLKPTQTVIVAIPSVFYKLHALHRRKDCLSSPNCLLGAVPYIGLALRGCHGLQASPKLRHGRCMRRQLGCFLLCVP
jgi:hypothetical protein